MDMRAIVLDGPVPPEELRVRRVPVPEPPTGWVRIKVEAFGLNRSEYHLRAGLATNAKFPVIPGIEAAGTVDLAPGGEFAPGQQVVAMMGGMGRAYDGGYAEYTVVPVASVIPVRTDLDWATLGALPEMLQTAPARSTPGWRSSRGSRCSFAAVRRPWASRPPYSPRNTD
ncbi:alcohol dehydrogenase catalytic domain-containing protein [Kribbella sp. GL6]|uniref:alcohol dehydrogenase catalytic domain-containing protein n=1 Tax=Kribbella sp. GL6 TaxID=3419765 RepID=UPI003CFD5599